MSFVLINALATFQGYINTILAEKLNVFIIVYLDDIFICTIFIFTKSERKKYVEAVKWILDKLKKYLLYANFKKCQLNQDEVRFLGYIVSH